jgi:hypothetical protein
VNNVRNRLIHDLLTVLNSRISSIFAKMLPKVESSSSFRRGV